MLIKENGNTIVKKKNLMEKQQYLNYKECFNKRMESTLEKPCNSYYSIYVTGRNINNNQCQTFTLFNVQGKFKRLEGFSNIILVNLILLLDVFDKFYLTFEISN